MASGPAHFLIVSLPAQGHINPSLQLAKLLVRQGALVTFATSVSVASRMLRRPDGGVGEGRVCFAPISDGYDQGFINDANSVQENMSDLRRRGSESLRDLITSSAARGCPFSCIIYTLTLPWAAEVARELGVPSTLLWIQPAIVLDIYHYYFSGYKDSIVEIFSSASSIDLPGLPMKLASRDLPSFLLPMDTYAFVLPTFQELLEVQEKEANQRVLVNTFDALEPEALKAIGKYRMTGIGPLVPSAFLGGRDPWDTSFGGDLFQAGSTKDYMQWLDSQAEGSVIYLSFGTIAVISKRQTEEVARGLLATGRPFLWVIRPKENKLHQKPQQQQEEEGGEADEHINISCMEELEKQGMIVPWCSQLEVLSHRSVGCFLTHCGWNSTLESVVCGVPVVAFPLWSDQGTNAKLLEEAWGTGVRVVKKRAAAEEEDLGPEVVEASEIRRCVEAVMAERREEVKGNAMRLKEMAMEAVREGGSSERNLRAFIEDVNGGKHPS
ncbi:hypothetical protein SAY87_021206 [Trapa incisa]|uniref:Glycosyltransferase n=1 Tax=Trapa incisa TaxID=236973 RepID=A0AAN7JWT4_9MYRT|nr:hypothetical protein SAY87_021206 [Trapa incisa]